MLAHNAGTYARLRKIFTGTPAECREKLAHLFRVCWGFPRADMVEITRGNNRIGYYRPGHGQWVNDKIYMIHRNADGSASLFI